MDTYKLVRNIKVEEGYDVLVAGAGPAGCAAAIAAARLGAKVLLVEAMGCLGGLSTAGIVSEFDPMSNGERMLVGGIMQEIVENMYSRGFMPDCSTPNRWRLDDHRYTSFKAEGLKLLLDEMVLEAGIEVRFFTRVIDADADKETRQVRGAIISNVDGYSYIKAKKFIDATGDAILADVAGVANRVAGVDTPHAMPPTLCAVFAGINWEGIEFKYEECCPKDQPEKIAKAIDDGIFSQPDYHLPGLFQVDDTVGYSNSGHIYGTNAVNNKSLTNAMFVGRRQVREYEYFYKHYWKGFENLQLVTTAQLLGVRETRRIVGEYEMTYEDFKKRRKFPDQIAVFGKSVDLHGYKPGKDEIEKHYERFYRSDKVAVGDYYGIPYGILVPKEFDNLWVAGRCVSTDVMVQAAIRVQPACSMMGQAAGTAAVQSLKTGQTARNIDTQLLVETLRENGAYLPQTELTKTLTLE